MLRCAGSPPFPPPARAARSVSYTHLDVYKRQVIPLLITSLGVTLAFKMRFWNIGAEGQICVGAIAATYFALFHDDWPQWILLVVMAPVSYTHLDVYKRQGRW